MNTRTILFSVLNLILTLSYIETARAAPSGVKLEDFLSQVQANSLDLKVEQAKLDEEKAKSLGLKIPPPMVGYMSMSDGSGSNKGFEVSQEIPLPSKIIKDKAVRAQNAQIQDLAYQSNRLSLMIDAERSYFEFWKSYEIKNLIEEKLTWIKNHAKLSRSLTRSDSAAQIHLLAIESEVDQIENELLEAKSDMTEKSNSLKAYAPHLSTENIFPTSAPINQAANINENTKSLDLKIKEERLLALNKNSDLKRESYFPDFVVRYRSYNGNDSTPRSNEVMIGVTLPFVFSGQAKSEASEALAQEQRAVYELEKSRVEFSTQMSSLQKKSQTLLQELEIFQSRLLPRAHQRMKLVESLTVRSIESLDEHRMVMFDYIDLRQKEVNLKFEIEKTTLELRRLASQQKDAP